MSKFEIFKSDADGQWYWRLKAKNGKIICQSEGYKKRSSAINGIWSVKKNAPIADIDMGNYVIEFA